MKTQQVIRDVMFVGAVAALSRGCWLAWPPLGWIVPSLFVLWMLLAFRGVVK